MPFETQNGVPFWHPDRKGPYGRETRASGKNNGCAYLLPRKKDENDRNKVESHLSARLRGRKIEKKDTKASDSFTGSYTRSEVDYIEPEADYIEPEPFRMEPDASSIRSKPPPNNSELPSVKPETPSTPLVASGAPSVEPETPSTAPVEPELVGATPLHSINLLTNHKERNVDKTPPQVKTTPVDEQGSHQPPLF